MRMTNGHTVAQPMKRRETAMMEQDERRPGRDLMKNLAVASALMLCLTALRSGAVPGLKEPTDAVLAAVSGDLLQDETLGRLSFVSAMFPEAVLVFGEQSSSVLTMPVSGGSLRHGWTREEPYTTWHAASDTVCAAIGGEVTGVYHGLDEELLVQVRAEGGLCCVHGNLASACVAVGDRVAQGQTIGRLLPGADIAFEVRQNGLSVDPVPLLP